MKPIFSLAVACLFSASLMTGAAFADQTKPAQAGVSSSAATPSSDMDRDKRHQERMEEHFNRMDTNHDGMISHDEFVKAHQDEGHHHHHGDHDGRGGHPDHKDHMMKMNGTNAASASSSASSH
jgi:hypothetical protein